MKIVVIGGTGLIGSKVVKQLTAQGHQVLAASPDTGVDTTTGRGLAEALAGANVVVDLSNTRAFDEATARPFFESSGKNLAHAEREAGVRHHVALSVVGTDRLQHIGYFRAKLAQEQIVKSSGIPYTIIRATQFFEFLGAIAAGATSGDTVRLPGASFQPIAADDVATAVATAAVGAPINDTIEIAGPDKMPMSALVERFLRHIDDARKVVTDPDATYFGGRVDDRSLVPGDKPRPGRIRLDDWIEQSKTSQAGAGHA